MLNLFRSTICSPSGGQILSRVAQRYVAKVMNTPSMGDSISEGTIQTWEKSLGERVEAGDVIATVETDKITVDVTAEFSGVISKIHVDVDDICMVGEPLVEIDPEGTAGAAPSGGSAGAGIEVKVPTMGDSITEGTVCEILKQVGDTVEKDDEVIMIETDKVTVPVLAPESGTVISHVEEGTEVSVGESVMVIGEAGAASTGSKPAAKKDSKKSETDAFGREIGLVPMSRMRQTVASRLKEAQNTAASLTTFNEVDMSPIMEMRKKHGKAFLEKNDVKLGFMSFFLKASTMALKEFPDINSYIAEDGKTTKVPSFVDISCAVASPTGLVVPVLRDCQENTLAAFEKSLAAVAAKARDGKITMEDMAGGNFTISNGGIFGSMMGTPIINPPQSSILGMHGIHERPVVRDGTIVARPMMYLALTYDHRIVDGRESVLFLKRIKELIENPSELGILEEI